ncbi:MAG: hypothetical protein H7333_07520, partial [Bdellovibrionales bacterium]|nr:hypothetical protein [Oligoflexia bacterium]
FSCDLKGTRIYSAYEPPPHSCFFSINPVHPTLDLAPTEPYHSPTKARRADINCQAFRTILCEFDKISLDEQLALIEYIDLPVSTLTYSGGKSIHALIVMDKDLERKAYDAFVRRIYRALGNEVDASNKNPSRLSRLPGALRDNGNTQDLISVRSRVSVHGLDQWLENRGVSQEVPIPMQDSFEGMLGTRMLSSRASPDTVNFLMGVYDEGTWNRRLFRACCELFKNGQDYQQVIQQCTQITGHLDAKDVSTIRSAMRTASR